MFSGIVEATGRIVEVRPAQDGARIRVHAPALDLGDVRLGDSVAVSGCCLTVVASGDQHLEFDVSGETLRCTAGIGAPGSVNLEKALRLSDRLGGHLVTGHVDGVGTVRRFEPVGESWLLEVEVPAELARYVARKGSIAVDGVSLTVNSVAGARFSVNLIPHTLSVTTLSALAPGGRVNLEVDLVARYLERMLAVGDA
jgi:riboflavin synthase